VYRLLSLTFSAAFALAGLLFLLLPAAVIHFFNGLSPALGMTPSPETGTEFYIALAVGYMYLVTVIAYMMYRHPSEKIFPLLLTNGKISTALLSAILFAAQGHYLIYVVNTVVDAGIALAAIHFYLKLRRAHA
jgi:hypothetical protein